MISLKLIFYLIIISIGYLCGLFLSYKNVLKIHGPNSNTIKKIKFNYNNKCFKLTPYIRKCV